MEFLLTVAEAAMRSGRHIWDDPEIEWPVIRTVQGLVINCPRRRWWHFGPACPRPGQRIRVSLFDSPENLRALGEKLRAGELLPEATYEAERWRIV